MPRTYFVYILASDTRELYVGVTSNLVKRVGQHRTGVSSDGFTARHLTTRLVYSETTQDVLAAMVRGEADQGLDSVQENRSVEEMNSDWKDFAKGW